MMGNEFLQVAGGSRFFNESRMASNPSLWPVVHAFYNSDKMDPVVGDGPDSKARFAEWAIKNADRILKIARRLDRSYHQRLAAAEKAVRTAELNVATKQEIVKRRDADMADAQAAVVRLEAQLKAARDAWGNASYLYHQVKADLSQAEKDLWNAKHQLSIVF